MQKCMKVVCSLESQHLYERHLYKLSNPGYREIDHALNITLSTRITSSLPKNFESHVRIWNN